MFGAGHVVPLPLRGLKNKHSCTWSFFAGRRRQMDGSADEKGKKRRKRGASGSVFVAPSVFIKTLLSPCERTGSRGGCLTQRRRRQPPTLPPRNYATFNQTAQKEDSKKDKVRDGNPFSIRLPPPGEVLDSSSRILCRGLLSIVAPFFHP